jgi:hypothetical protein
MGERKKAELELKVRLGVLLKDLSKRYTYRVKGIRKTLSQN